MLKKKYEESIERFKAVLEYPWHNKEFYAAWLTQTYSYSRHVTRILMLASVKSPHENVKMHRRFHVHAGEENNHELLAERDVKDLGYDVKTIGEFPITNGFYATQYYTIEYVSPESLFGWILPLEGLALHYGQGMWDRVQQTPKMPDRFLKVHVNEDPDHVASALKTVENFNPKQEEQVCKNIEFTVDTYFRIMEACKQYAAASKGKKAA